LQQACAQLLFQYLIFHFMHRSTYSHPFRQTARLLLGGLALPALLGCQSTKTVADKIRNIETPALVYKLEVVQGNFVSSEQVAALRAGMPKAQVKNILGTPLLTDIFHQDRWDYIFTLARDGKAQPPRKLTVFFKGESLDRWEGDAMPSENDFVKSLSSGRKLTKAPPLEATEKQLADFAKRENSNTKPAAPLDSTSAGSTNIDKIYPALESK
jgi:outer membrane protein assembly factor BamE